MLLKLGLLVLLGNGVAHGQLTITIKKVPSNTPAADVLYVAGSFNNWTPAANGYSMVGNPTMGYSITLPASVKGAVQFKITRGTWANCEAMVNGAQAPNRSVSISTTGPTAYTDSVAAWADLTAPTSTASPSVSVLNASFWMPQLGLARRIWIYLPPDYATTTKQYPVLYMHDGQNLFDALTSYSGEWNVDETLDKLQAQGDYGCIVIGIDNGGGNRINEYSAYKNPKYGGGQGDAYMRFLAETLKPYIDGQYRTYTDAAHTGLMGSSLGGLITLYGGLSYGHVFGRVGVFSPSLWFTDSIYKLAATQGPNGPESGLYFMSGRQESKTQVQEQARMVQTLQTAGWQLPTEVDSLTQNGTHSETLWRKAFPAGYAWLFGSVTSTKNAEQNRLTLSLFPNPGAEAVTLTVKASQAISGICQLVDVCGRPVREATMVSGLCRFLTEDLAKGVYHVRMQGQANSINVRWLK